jgi:hypothetical protein
MSADEADTGQAMNGERGLKRSNVILRFQKKNWKPLSVSVTVFKAHIYILSILSGGYEELCLL